jgi:acetyl-CoA C-acetyltransferase
MREAVIVSTARTPIGKAYRGGFNNLGGASLGAASVAEAVKRAGIDPARVEDVIMGAALQQGATGSNIARQIALRAGLPVTVSGMSIDRQCSSGLMAVATAAKQVIDDGMTCVVGGGLESISLVQNENMNIHRMVDEELMALHPNIHMPMLQTAEVVADRYGISRDAMDEYGLQSQQRTAAAYEAGRYADELVDVTCQRTVWDKETGEASEVEATVSADEGIRATTAEGLAGLKTVIEGGTITAGNASQLSDGSSAQVVMDAKVAEQEGLEPLGIYRGIAVAGCEPDEMGIGPVFAVPKLLGHRSGVRSAQAAQAARPVHGRYRPVGTERGLRGAGDLLPRPVGHRQRQAQRRRRCHLHRPPLRHEWLPDDRPRPDRGQAPRGQVRGDHHVRGRWHGCRRPVRGGLI